MPMYVCVYKNYNSPADSFHIYIYRDTEIYIYVYGYIYFLISLKEVSNQES